MTTESPASPEPDPIPEPAATQPVVPPTAPSPMSNMSGESLVMIGSLLILASYLVFQLITGEFFQYITGLVAAAFGALLPLISKDGVKGLASGPVLMKTIGYVIAVSGVFEILYDVRFQVLDEAMAVIGALVAYAGYVVAFFGARSIKT